MTSSPMVSCKGCTHPVEPAAKFCGECGAANIINSNLESHATVARGHHQVPINSAFSQAAQRLARVESIKPHSHLSIEAARAQMTASVQMPDFEEPPRGGMGVRTTPQMPGRSALSHPGLLHQPMPEAYVAYGQPGRLHANAFAGGATEPLPEGVKAPNKVNYDDLAKLESFRLAQVNHRPTDWRPTPSPNPDRSQQQTRPSGFTPAFASTKSGAVPSHLINEMQTLNTHILRERLFLLMHTGIFLIANLVGFVLALKCYYGYNGDEVSRIVMALTPLTFINAVALACLAPIKGTRREIARLLEKRQFLRVQIEYSNVRF